MIVDHDIGDYHACIQQLTARDDDVYNDFTECCKAVSRYWVAQLTPASLKVLAFIMGRTLSYGKRGEIIGRPQFLKGIVNVCAGAGVSDRTLTTALAELNDLGFINSHRFMRGNAESARRIHVVDVENILNGVPKTMADNWNARKNMPKQPPVKVATPPLHKLRDVSNTYISNGDTIVSPPDRSAPGLSSPRKPRQPSKVDVNIKRSAAEIAAGLQANSQATRDTRVATSRDPAGRPWSKQQLQALLDKAHATVRDEGYATQRIVAIDKGRKLLQQRMTDRGIKDALEFFEYVLRNWSTIAAAHSNATKRKRTEGQDLGRSIHRSPNFDDLYQRLPYIATIFLNDEFRTAEAQIERDREEEKKRQGAQERQEAQRTRRQIARQRDLEREEQRKREEQALASRVERTRTSPRRVADDLPEMPTSFEEWQARRKNAK